MVMVTKTNNDDADSDGDDDNYDDTDGDEDLITTLRTTDIIIEITVVYRCRRIIVTEYLFRSCLY